MKSVSAENAVKYYYEKDPLMASTEAGFGTDNSFYYGNIAKVFGLEYKNVDKESFSKLLEGKDPKTGIELVKGSNSHDNKHRAGMDITFNAPKSVSVLLARTENKELRQAIINAQINATKAGLNFIQQEAMLYREYNKEDKTQIYKQSDSLIVAVFTHTTSRENDPQLHNHAVVQNMTLDKEGNFKSWATEEMFRLQSNTIRIYKNALALELEKIGIKTEQVSINNFEIKNFDTDIRDTFSKRTTQIDNYLEENKLEDNPENRQIACYKTRTNKDGDLTYNELMKMWKDEEIKNNISTKVESFLKEQEANFKTEFKEATSEEIKDLVKDALYNVQASKAYFSLNDIREEALKINLIKVNLKEIDKEFKEIIKEEGFIGRKHVIGEKTELLYTTKEYYNLEQELISELKKAQNAEPLMTKEEATKYIKQFEKIKSEEIKDTFKLSRDQEEAVFKTLTTPGRIKTWQGDAGAGKSTASSAISYALQEKNNDNIIIGLGSTGKVANALAETGIETMTIHKYNLNNIKEETNNTSNTNNINTNFKTNETGFIDIITRTPVSMFTSTHEYNGDLASFVQNICRQNSSTVREELKFSVKEGFQKQKTISKSDFLGSGKTLDIENNSKRYLTKTHMRVKGDYAKGITTTFDKNTQKTTTREFETFSLFKNSILEGVFKISKTTSVIKDENGKILATTIDNSKTLFGITRGTRTTVFANGGLLKESYTTEPKFFGETKTKVKVIENRKVDSIVNTKKVSNDKMQEIIQDKKPKMIIVDETSMSDLKQMLRLVKQANKDGTYITAIGDTKQLSAINAGNVQKLLLDNTEKYSLTTNNRQKTEREKDYVNTIASWDQKADKTEQDKHWNEIYEKGKKNGIIQFKKEEDIFKEIVSKVSTTINNAKEKRKIDPQIDIRKEIAVAVKTNREARIINNEVRKNLFDTTKDITIKVEVENRKNAFEKRKTENYSIGSTITYFREEKDENGKTVKSKLNGDYTIKAKDDKTNTLTLKNKTREITINLNDREKHFRAITEYKKEDLNIQKGDLIVKTKNNGNTGILDKNNKAIKDITKNGDVGEITKIEKKEDGVYVTAKFYNKEVTWNTDKENIKIAHSYASTMYKAQGETFKAFITKDVDTREKLYVGVSRAKEEAIIYFSKQQGKDEKEVLERTEKIAKRAFGISEENVVAYDKKWEDSKQTEQKQKQELQTTKEENKTVRMR
jgi:conjugative relaxase-like TrwC/TraI family protein